MRDAVLKNTDDLFKLWVDMERLKPSMAPEIVCKAAADLQQQLGPLYDLYVVCTGDKDYYPNIGATEEHLRKQFSKYFQYGISAVDASYKKVISHQRKCKDWKDADGKPDRAKHTWTILTPRGLEQLLERAQSGRFQERKADVDRKRLRPLEDQGLYQCPLCTMPVPDTDAPDFEKKKRIIQNAGLPSSHVATCRCGKEHVVTAQAE